MNDDQHREQSGRDADEPGDSKVQEQAADDAGADYDLNEVIENLCVSKANEFRMLGYEQVSGRDIWDCVSDKYHKTGVPPLHQVVNDILSLKVTQFMNWMTMRVYRGSL